MQSYRDLAKERDDLISENSMLRNLIDVVIARAKKIEVENKLLKEYTYESEE